MDIRLCRIISLSLIALFYLCYFGKMYIQRKQGIDTDQLGKGKEGFVKFIELSLKTIAIIAPIVELISIFFISKVSLLWGTIGLVFTALGVLSFYLAVFQMDDNWRAGVQLTDKTKLVTQGVYRYSRNPAFLGFDLMHVGILIIYFNWYLCPITILTLILFHLQIVNVEEVFLIERFGEEYISYMNVVNRYFGRK